jgi:hypothetical protein
MVRINYVPIPVFETSLFDSTYNKNSGGRKLSAWIDPPLFKNIVSLDFALILRIAIF